MRRGGGGVEGGGGEGGGEGGEGGGEGGGAMCGSGRAKEKRFGGALNSREPDKRQQTGSGRGEGGFLKIWIL